ncbi:hypothetical protein [Sphingomonas sp. NFX23]|uniref:hypothetical protein n=1 Tax=Sphingomonas sp. NFX23 TaxID=2819532 RepID=UPI003CF32085
MTFTIGQTFDLLFGSAIATTGKPTYDDRRWFRRPPPLSTLASTPSGDVRPGSADRAEADGQLAMKVGNCVRRWAVAAAPTGHRALDPIRHIPPRLPYDVFAAAAHLIENAGVYHHIQPIKMMPVGGTSPDAAHLRHIDITPDDSDLVRRAAERWRTLGSKSDRMVDLSEHLTNGDVWKDMEPLFESWWVLFCANEDANVLDRGGDGSAVPFWWKHAWRLLAIADEAAKGTMYQLDIEQIERFDVGKPAEILWMEFELFLEHAQRMLPAASAVSEDDDVGEFGDINSLSIASPAVVSVLPKVRTPSVGCTLRSLSHHLALLPPVGIVKGRWTPNFVRPSTGVGRMPAGVMNLLLVPLPFSLDAKSFDAAMIEDVSGSGPGAVPRFGYFGINQHWINDVPRNKLLDFVEAVIDAGLGQADAIHGLVFPELALDYEAFEQIRTLMRAKLPQAEILIAGTSSNGAGREGNFVATSTFPTTAGAGPDQMRETVREKHHRWKLDRTQLRDYGLLGTLSPELSWWENISLQSRLVDFTVMRRDSVFAAMICEDLARIDPCQQIIRAVGPNLVVALLMDAPQVEARWPARYATVLAEDPGCAVLTLTSRGLMTLQHRLGTFRSNGDDRIVAMWRDDGASRPLQLKCPYDAQAVLLTIAETAVEDVALDGRRDGGAKAWRYQGSVPVRIGDRERHSEVLGEQDKACW